MGDHSGEWWEAAWVRDDRALRLRHLGSGVGITRLEWDGLSVEGKKRLTCKLDGRAKEIRMPTNDPNGGSYQYYVGTSNTTANPNILSQQIYGSQGLSLGPQETRARKMAHHEYRICGHIVNYPEGGSVPEKCPTCTKEEQDREKNIKAAAEARKREQDRRLAPDREPLAWLDREVREFSHAI